MTTNRFGYFHYNTHCDKNYDQEFVILTKDKKTKVATIDGDGKTILSFEHPEKLEMKNKSRTFLEDTMYQREAIFYLPHTNELNKDDVCFKKMFFKK